MLLSESEKAIPQADHDPREISKMMLTNFHLLLKAQIEIGKETDIKKINEILSKHGIPILEREDDMGNYLMQNEPIHSCTENEEFCSDFWCYQENCEDPIFLTCGDFGVAVKFCPFCGYSKKNCGGTADD